MTIKKEILLDIEEVCSLTGLKKETVRRKCKNKEFTAISKRNGKQKEYFITLQSLPISIQELYLNPTKNYTDDAINKYNNAPEWAKRQAEKYLELFELTDKLTYKEKLLFLKNWAIKYPNKKVSYPSLMEAKRKYNNGGVSELLPKYGKHRIGISSIPEDYYEYFKSLYLKEGAPSANSCWRVTLGYAKTNNTDLINFPSCSSFIRKLKNNTPEQAIYMARYGNSAWYKKYASYIPRDYSNILAGSFWVSDHAQLDVAVNFLGNVYFPWVTVFRDIKTSKWLGWFLHAEAPNSDHIFQAFYYGVQRFGLPSDVYLDNGKDYRCKDFAGGRKQLKVAHNEVKENSLMKNIGVNVHFALPYNAQTKPVERDFLKIKEFLSKHFAGYRGGKITERPEKLKSEIKNEKIMQFNEFKEILDDFIKNYLNKKPSNGKVLQGKSPDELWAKEFTTKKIISKDALKLFCMRSSNIVKIGRNGIYDSQLQITYWSEWMISEKGRKVFIRRDINAYQEAWVFDAISEAYLGKGNVNQAVSFLAKTNVEKVHYKTAIMQKNKEKKILKAYLKCKYNPSNAEIVNNLKTSLSEKNYNSNPKITRISNTKMDKVIAEDKKLNIKPAKYVTPLIPKQKLYLTESEKKRELSKRAM